MFERMVDQPGIGVLLSTDYVEIRPQALGALTVFTGRIDEFFGHRLGRLLSGISRRNRPAVLPNEGVPRGAAAAVQATTDVPALRIGSSADNSAASGANSGRLPSSTT
jgi:UDP-galactopyranose mutase